MRKLLHMRLGKAIVACVCALAAAHAPAQGSYSPYDETPGAALARYVRVLADDPKDFQSLIGAGKAALEMGDAQAAAGFFARADDVDPRSPEPQAGMGAVSVANGDPKAAMPYFKQAQQLGADVISFACDRGLAYDLLGQQAQAQADYRLALTGRDGDEARRRLALSLAISGDRATALQTLAPLSAKGDAGVARVRAFVLALTGDSVSAAGAINAVMPGASASVMPLLQRLPALSAGQKAAAVNLGLFPDAGQVNFAANGDRLAGVDAWLHNASTVPTSVQPAQRTTTAFQPKIWLQLAAAADVDTLATRFERLKVKNPDMFDGVKPYVSRSEDRARLLVGPFRGPTDAETFAEDLKSIGVAASRFTNSQTDRIAPLATQ